MKKDANKGYIHSRTVKADLTNRIVRKVKSLLHRLFGTM